MGTDVWNRGGYYVVCSGRAPEVWTNKDEEREGWEDLRNWGAFSRGNNVKKALGARLEGLFRVAGRQAQKSCLKSCLLAMPVHPAITTIKFNPTPLCQPNHCPEPLAAITESMAQPALYSSSSLPSHILVFYLG